MTPEEEEQLHERARAAVRAMTPEERLEGLKDIGILDRHGRLSSRYGGPGELTDPEVPTSDVPYGPQ